MTDNGLRAPIEAILMIASEPVAASDLADVLDVSVDAVEEQLRALAAEYLGDGTEGRVRVISPRVVIHVDIDAAVTTRPRDRQRSERVVLLKLDRATPVELEEREETRDDDRARRRVLDEVVKGHTPRIGQHRQGCASRAAFCEPLARASVADNPRRPCSFGGRCPVIDEPDGSGRPSARSGCARARAAPV